MGKRFRIMLAFCVLTGFLATPLSVASERVLKVARSVDASTMDPHRAIDTGSTSYMLEVYEPLLALDLQNNLVPVLATSWDRVDERTYRFELRKGVKFHNGEPLMADDVVFSLKRATSPIASAVKVYGDMIDPDGFEVIDPHTVLVRTKTPMTPFLFALQTSFGFILNRKAVEEAGENYGRTSVVGTGAFKFVSWTRSDRMEFERFDDYWGPAPEFGHMTIRTVPEASSRSIELETGTVDVAGDLPPSEAIRLGDEGVKLGLRVLYTPNPAINYLGFNTASKGPLGDKRVRNAIDLALDKEAIIEAVLYGKGRIPAGPIPYFCRYTLDEAPRKQNLELAKTLLKEAGWEQGFTMSLWTNDSKTRIDMATIIQAQLAELGITVDIQVLEWGTFLERLRSSDQVESFLIGTATAAPDPFFALNASFGSKYIGSSNRSRLSDSKIDELLERGQTVPDGPERTAIYTDLWNRINEERPWAYISIAYVIIGIKDELVGTEGIETRTDQRHGFLKIKR